MIFSNYSILIETRRSHKMLKTLADIDLGRSVLSLAIILGFFLVILTIIRSIEIPIRIYLDRRKKGISSNSNTEEKEEKGF